MLPAAQPELVTPVLQVVQRVVTGHLLNAAVRPEDDARAYVLLHEALHRGQYAGVELHQTLAAAR